MRHVIAFICCLLSLQSQGWVHYMAHEPEPHILLFRRPLPPKETGAN